MNKTAYFTLWGGMFIICAGLGFIPEPEGFLRVLFTALAIGFFLPPFFLCREAKQKKDLPTLHLLRNLSALWLLVAVVLIIGNFLSLFASEAVGNVLYMLLVIATSPMVCGGSWIISLFLWACLLVVSVQGLRMGK